MPVLIADAAGRAVGVAHAGWRGLAHGVIERTSMPSAANPPNCWPGSGRRSARASTKSATRFARRSSRQDPAAESAFRATRPGHWLLDLYAVARQRLAARGVMRVFGGEFCTYSEPARFFSFRRERVCGRMAALIWID